MIYEFGDISATTVLIQPVGEHDAAGIERELKAIGQMTDRPFRLAAVRVEQWNRDLSPWRAPAVFRNEDFGYGAAATLDQIAAYCGDVRGACFIGGYSLAALFSLWASCQTDLFTGVAAASPSMWFPGFLNYLKEHPIRSRAVYLSMGDKEEKTGHPVLAAVGDCIREGYDLIRAQNVDCVLEWNPGNHLREPELRTAKAFAWTLKGNT